MTRRLLLVLVMILALAAPGGGQERSTLTVFGAADLSFALQELAARFEKVAGVKVTLVLGSTGNLSRQIEHGAPADRKSTRLNSSHIQKSRMPSSA